MKTILNHLLDRLRSSFWLVPGTLVIASIVAAALLINLDLSETGRALRFGHDHRELSPEGSRTLLGVVATSVLALAGVTFSVTIVTLTLASSQFGPRLLRNFIRSRAIQISLGLLLATYTYSLVVLTMVRTGEDSFTPHLATHGAIGLALVSLGVFIYFIHHVVTSIQAERVVAEVHRELMASIDRLMRGDDERAEVEEDAAREVRDRWHELEEEEAICSHAPGYVQAIHVEKLVALTRELGTAVRVLVHPGAFVVEGEAVLAIPANSLSGEDDEARRRLGSGLILGDQRTAEQDLEYCVRQLVEVALRALSPGINDPFTAINCIHYLGSALAAMARRGMPAHEFPESGEEPRVKMRPQCFESLLGVACNQIRQASAERPDVSLSLLDMLLGVARQARTGHQLRALDEQGQKVAEVASAVARTSIDARAIEERHENLREYVNSRTKNEDSSSD